MSWRRYELTGHNPKTRAAQELRELESKARVERSKIERRLLLTDRAATGESPCTPSPYLSNLFLWTYSRDLWRICIVERGISCQRRLQHRY